MKGNGCGYVFHFSVFINGELMVFDAQRGNELKNIYNNILATNFWHLFAKSAVLQYEKKDT
jgi:hypothetical protein